MPKQNQQASQTCFQATGDKNVLVMDPKKLIKLCQNCSVDAAEAVGKLQNLYAPYDGIMQKYQLNKVNILL